MLVFILVGDVQTEVIFCRQVPRGNTKSKSSNYKWVQCNADQQSTTTTNQILKVSCDWRWSEPSSDARSKWECQFMMPGKKLCGKSAQSQKHRIQHMLAHHAHKTSQPILSFLQPSPTSLAQIQADTAHSFEDQNAMVENHLSSIGLDPKARRCLMQPNVNSVSAKSSVDRMLSQLSKLLEDGKVAQCTGFKVQLPGQFSTSYPFASHSSGHCDRPWHVAMDAGKMLLTILRFDVPLPLPLPLPRHRCP